MKLTSKRFVVVFTLGLLLVVSHTMASLLVLADELPIDPDFVRTWDLPTPTPSASPTITAKPAVTKPIIRNTTPSITDADRQAVAEANEREQDLLENFERSQTEKNRIKSLAEDSLQKFQALQDVNGALKDELLILDEQERQTKATINRIDEELVALNGQLDITTNKLLLKEQELGEQKRALVSYVQAIYAQENTSVLQVLLSNKSFADSLDELNHMQSLESIGQSLVDQLKASQEQLRQEQDVLQQKKERLDRLFNQLEEQQNALEIQQEEKRFLLDKTQGKEEEYQLMLQEFRRQAEAVEAEINSLKGEIEKMKTPDSIAALERAFGEKYALTNPQNGAIWPVDASYKGISAYFRDSGYLKLFGFPHSAIDIPEPAQTPIRAPANGVVLHTVDNDGGSYNYLVLYHGMDDEGRDITTVYGHIPKFFVKKGDIVRKGEIVALTGGAPGTRGTGPYYTGPHLHFEVRQNGVAIDPLTWLP